MTSPESRINNEIEQIADAFEDEWRQYREGRKETPNLKDYLERAREAPAPRLFERLINIHVEHYYRHHRFRGDHRDSFTRQFDEPFRGFVHDAWNRVTEKKWQVFCTDCGGGFFVNNETLKMEMKTYGNISCRWCPCSLGPPRDARPAPPSPPRHGVMRVGKYLAVSFLGHGSFGTVWLGIPAENYSGSVEELVAIKLLPLSGGTQDMKFRGITGANIAAIKDWGVTPQFSYVISQYVPGQDLRMLIDGVDQLALEDKLKILRDIANGLESAHSQKIIHRDVRPSNVMVTQTAAGFVAKIIDFGVSRELVDSPAETAVGTPYYTAPELWRHEKKYRYEVDVWSFGVLAYELLVGERPFHGNISDLKDAIQNRIPLPPCERDREIPTDLSTVVMKCLAKDGRQRPRDGGELVRLLDRLGSDGQGVTVATTKYHVASEPVSEPAKRKRRTSTWVIIACTPLLIAILYISVVAGWAAKNSNNFEKQFGLQVSEDGDVLEFKRGEISSFKRQVATELKQVAGVDSSKIHTLAFTNMTITLRDEDLVELPHLGEVIFENCRLYWDVKAYSGLRYFEANNCQFSGRLDFSNANNITVLYLNNCKGPQGVTGLAGKGQLCRLKIANCRDLTEPPEFAGLTGLLVLELTDPKFELPDSVFSLEQLRVFYLGGVRLPNLDRFRGLPELEVLSVEFCWGLTDITAIEHLEHLRELNLGSPQVGSWIPLVGKSQLDLYVDGLTREARDAIPIDDEKLFSTTEFWENEAAKHAAAKDYCDY